MMLKKYKAPKFIGALTVSGRSVIPISCFQGGGCALLRRPATSRFRGVP